MISLENLTEAEISSWETKSPQELIRIIGDVSAILTSAEDQDKVARQNLEILAPKIREVLQQLELLRDERNTYEQTRQELKPRIVRGRAAKDRLDHYLRRAQLRELEAQEFAKRMAAMTANMSRYKWSSAAFPHQIEGAQRLAAVGSGILGDQRGLGKTMTSLIWLDFRKAKKVLVLAPKETLKNFEEEIKMWASHRTIFSLGSKSKARRDVTLDLLEDAEQFILTVNLEAWRKDPEFIRQMAALQLDSVIIDEAHNIKSADTTAFKGVEAIVLCQNKCPECGHWEFKHNDQNHYRVPLLAHKDSESTGVRICLSCAHTFNRTEEAAVSVKNVLPMTGTPILNRANELWAPLTLIDRKSFPTESDFVKNYCWGTGSKIYFRAGGERELLRKIGPQYIRRDRNTVGIKVPPQKIQVHRLYMDPAQYGDQVQAYIQLREFWQMFVDESMEDGVSIQAAIAHLLRLRQMILWPAGIEWRHPKEKDRIIFKCDIKQSVKLDKAHELITELVDEGERVVVFSQFKAPLHELRRRLAETQVTFADGEQDYISSVVMDSTANDDLRDEIRHDFDRRYTSEEDYKWDVVLCNYRVAGESVNLNAATQMVILDEQWNPGKEDQAFGRIDRMGQLRETTVHILRCDVPKIEASTAAFASVDTFMANLISKKRELIDGLDQEADIQQEILKGLMEGRV